MNNFHYRYTVGSTDDAALRSRRARRRPELSRARPLVAGGRPTGSGAFSPARALGRAGLTIRLEVVPVTDHLLLSALEEDRAVLSRQDGTTLSVPAAWLPEGAKVGASLRATIKPGQSSFCSRLRG